MIPKTMKDARYENLDPLGRLPRARMNCSSKKARYPYFTIVLIIGVASLPKGKAVNLLLSLGVPTKSMITEVVSQ
jgi:hypothetical protein